MKVMHERNAHNIPLDLVVIETPFTNRINFIFSLVRVYELMGKDKGITPPPYPQG